MTSHEKEIDVSLIRDFKEQLIQLHDVQEFLNMLWKNHDLSKLFRSDLAKIRCRICESRFDCSLVDDPNTCLFDEAQKP
jgi:hypothetical protein